MANINFKYGLENSLQNEPLSEGVMYLTLDTKYIYADLQVNGVLTRVKISDLTSLQSNLNALSNSLNELSTKVNNLVIPTKVSDLTQDINYLKSYTETDPTVPTWAKSAMKPVYTATEVGADATGTAATAVSNHNIDKSAHSDIRKYVDDKVAGLVNSAPGTLDTLNELATALGNDENFATTIAEEIGNRVEKEPGKGLSTNDFTTAHKTKLENLKTAASNGYNGTIYTSGDGVAEMGKYIDFHNTSTGTNDYDTRLVCTGETQNQINLPTNNGTLIIGDKEYKIVVSSSKPASGTASNVITIVTGG